MGTCDGDLVYKMVAKDICGMRLKDIISKEEAKIMFPDKAEMTIDLTEWNEYIADDVSPGPIPCGIELETMSICTADSFKRDPKDGTPSFLEPKRKTVKQRLFWRIKK